MAAQRGQSRLSGLALLVLAAYGAGSCFTFSGLATGLNSSRATGRTASPIARAGGGIVQVPGDLKKELRLLVDDQPVVLIDYLSKKQGKGVAITKAKLRNMVTGAIFEKTMNSGSKYETVDTEWMSGTFSYKDEVEQAYHVLDMETFEDKSVPADVVGEIGDWLTEGQGVDFEIYKGIVIKVQMQGDIIMEIAEIKQAKENNKDVTVVLSNGITKQAPPYIKVGDKVEIDKKNFEIKGRI
eukprot:gb/GFBE01083153.1/.p1 GENE.gb/GFBE01083153.1/~~gb/GFBE01083153.1/.p1  ORF type:complete len:240 (+),score=85.74 gb/GFBE01083153.1/:1-720(+)